MKAALLVVINWLKQFFEDNTGGSSTMRAMFWLWMIVMCFNVTYVNLKDHKLEMIDGGYVSITAMLAAAKVGQRIWGEPNDTTTPTPPITPPPVKPPVVPAPAPKPPVVAAPVSSSVKV